jgi:hypothetical protein
MKKPCITQETQQKFTELKSNTLNQFVQQGIEAIRAQALATRQPRLLPGLKGRDFLAGFS